MYSKIVLIAAVIAVTSGRLAPHADILESFKKTPVGSRISDDVYADAELDAPGLIAKYGYPVEVHHVTTSDGYILEAHRIPHGRDRNNRPGPRPVVFLMHGLLSSSADFVVLGPENALAYLLAEEGYDVWLGNARGNYYSRRHIRLNPDRLTTDFWKFSWEQIGLYDLPAFVDYILDLTGERQLHYVGHSQGGTTFLVLNSLSIAYNGKFKSFHGLAPASYFNHNTNALFNSLAPLEKALETAYFAVSTGEIMNNEQAKQFVLSGTCAGAESIFSPWCVEQLRESSEAMAGVNASLIPLFLSNAPAGASIRQIAHYGQVIRRKAFARFYFDPMTNLLRYGRLTPPQLNVGLISVPSYLYYGLADTLVAYEDLLTLSQRLPNVKDTFQVERESFNHYDFVWGIDVKSQVYDRLIENLRKADA